MPVVNTLIVTSIALFAGVALAKAADKEIRFAPGPASSYATRQTIDKITIAAGSREPNQVNLVCGHVEVVERVPRDWLGEHEEVSSGRAGEVVVRRYSEDGRTRGAGNSVKANRPDPCLSV